MGSLEKLIAEEPPAPETPVNKDVAIEDPNSLPESPIPIPGTIETKPDPSSRDEGDQVFEARDVKIDGVCQVACLFPEGEEKRGQLFVRKLREAGRLVKQSTDIQAVFIQAWHAGDMDVQTMEKSASLAGASFTFILVPKDKRNLFHSQMTNATQGEWQGRVVLLEHVELRTLYADVLVQLGRHM